MEKNLLCALKECVLFADMSFADIENVLESVSYRLVYYDKRDVYAVAGSDFHHTDIMVFGSLEVRMTGLSGRQVEVIRLKRGDVIGPCFLFASDNRLPVTIEAEERVCVLRMSADAFQTLVDSHSVVRWNFIRLLSDLNSYLISKIKFLSLMTLREKILYLIRTEIKSQGSKTIVLGRSRQRIADAFAVQKFSVLRCLGDLAAQGVIRVKGRVITVMDTSRLQR